MLWNINSDIDWPAFDSARVDRNILQVIKSAALVEANASDYVAYLCGVWQDNPDLQQTVKQWGREESRHGEALARWASLADPGFDFPSALERFRKMQAIDTAATASIRGSPTGELVARCVVETGTSSLYAAIRDATDEPVLKQLTTRIAADEFAHYALFSALIKKQHQQLPRVSRLKIALARLFEASDDELASAYYCAARPPSGELEHFRKSGNRFSDKKCGNNKELEPGFDLIKTGNALVYERKLFSNAYQLGVLRIYQRRHINRLVAMIARAGGLKPHGLTVRFFQPLVWFALNVQKKRLIRILPSHI